MWWLTPVIPATWGAEIGGLYFKVTSGNKVSKILSQKQARHDSFNLRYAGDRGRRTTVQFCLIVKTDRPYLRNKLKKKGWRSD
jgi:hypothetical protein